MGKEDIKEKPLSEHKMQIEATKFALLSPEERIGRFISLPSGYGKDKIMVMVRDPWWIFAYWEITEARERAVREEIARCGDTPERSVLRVYEITGIKDFNGTKANSYSDIALSNMARNWYINVGEPNKNWCVDIGIVTDTNRLFTLARSNAVKTPRFGISDILDEEWMCREEMYWILFGVSGGFDIGKSSLEMKELFKRYLHEWISSGGISSFGSHDVMRPK